jgi:hypothetical protein
VRCFVSKLSRTLFFTLDSPTSLPDGSGCWIRMIRVSVLRRWTSHLPLIRTNLGYGTVLTAACARQGCSATHYYYYYYYYHHRQTQILSVDRTWRGLAFRSHVLLPHIILDSRMRTENRLHEVSSVSLLVHIQLFTTRRHNPEYHRHISAAWENRISVVQRLLNYLVWISNNFIHTIKSKIGRIHCFISQNTYRT